MTDGFHEGEYLTNLSAMRQYYAGMRSFPIFIHGPMDYVPSLIASFVRGDDHVIVWTRFLNTIAVAFCWVVWLDISKMILRRNVHRYLWTAVSFALFFWMSIATGDDVLHKQGAFLGTRDLFLISSVWCLVKACLAEGRRQSTHLLFCLAGMFAAASLYWSYDRGVLATAWITASAVACIFLRRKTDAVEMILCFVLALAAIGKLHFLGSFHENLHNIAYWSKNSRDVWHMSLKIKLLAIPSALGIIVFASMVMLYALLKVARRPKRQESPLVLGLVAMQLLFLLKLYNEPAFPTSYYHVWPSFLILIIVPPTSSPIEFCNQAFRSFLRNLWQAWYLSLREEKVLGIASLVLIFVLCSNTVIGNVLALKQVLRPDADNKLIDWKHYGFDYMNKQRFGCVFQWSNEGIFAFAAKRPFCTSFPYAVYISKSEESSVLAELQRSLPRLIVYDSPHWSMNIWGRSMKERLPRIDKFIQENYVFHDSGSGYVFATPKSPLPQ